MRNRYTYIMALSAILLCVGCEERFHGEYLGVVPSLQSRHLGVSPKNIVVPSSQEYTTGLSVISENTPWIFEGFPSWTSLSPVSGNGDAEVAMDAAENQSADTARYAVFFFSSEVPDWDYTESLTVSQPAAIPYLTLSVDDIEISGAANEYTIDVLSNAKWSLSNDYSWIDAKTQEKSLVLHIHENHTGYSREATLSVQALDCTETIHIVQLSANATVVEETLEFEKEATIGKFTITSEVEWKATVSKSWIQVTPDTGTAGTTEITIDIAPNQGIEERSGNIIFSCGNTTQMLSVKVIQQGMYLNMDTEEVVFDALDCSKDLHIRSNVDWVVTSYPQWAVPSATSGSGNAVINIHAEENPSTSERIGFFVVEYPRVSLSAEARITQKGKFFDVGMSVIDFSDKASTNTVEIAADDTWEATCDAEWVTLSPCSADGSSTLAVTVTENTSPDSRIALVYVTMRDKTVELSVRQQGKYLSLGNSQLEFPSKGGHVNLFIDTNDKWLARLENNATWLNLSATEGTGAVDVVVTATDNATLNERSEVLEITTLNSLCTRLPIKQAARFLSVNAINILFFARGGTSDRVTIKTNATYQMSQTGDWFAISRTGDSFVVTALKNETKGQRVGSITITMTNLTEGSYAITIPVRQVQSGCNFALSGYGEEINQDNASGGGEFGNTGFGEDVNWDASLGNVFSIHLVGFTVDDNWDANSSNTFTVTATGYTEDKEWDNKDSVDTTLGKDDFGADDNQDNDDVTDTSFGKQGFCSDDNWDE